MYNEFLIAKVKYDEMVAELNRANRMEGVTLPVPNLFERALAAARAVLAGHLTNVARPATTLRHGVAAK